MLRKIRTAVAAVLVLVALAAIPAMAAQPAGKGYTGGWKAENTDPSIRMEVFDNGTMYYVFGDEDNVGHYCSYFIDKDGSLCVYENNSIVDAYGMLNQNQLLDYQGLVWNRMY